MYTKMGFMLMACLAGIVSAGNGFAADTIEVVRASGNVVAKQDDQQQDLPVSSRSILPAKHILVTGSDGRAVVRMGDSGYIVVEKNSRIEVNREKDHAHLLRQITGIIYYAVNIIKGPKQPLEVRTATATIGVRGTRFLVTDLPERKEIGVRKGLVNVASLGEDFEIHKKAQEDEFEAYKREAKEAIAEEKRKFLEYKEKETREFIEYKREFGLGANRMATFDGNRVDERPLSDETLKDMESLEVYGEQWIAEVRD